MLRKFVRDIKFGGQKDNIRCVLLYAVQALLDFQRLIYRLLDGALGAEELLKFNCKVGNVREGKAFRGHIGHGPVHDALSE